MLCYICPKYGISSLVTCNLFPIDINGRLLTCRQYFHIRSAFSKRLLWRLKLSNIPVTSSVIIALSIHAVHCIPGMWKRHVLPILRITLHQPYILFFEFPPLIQINDLSHIFSFFLHFYRMHSRNLPYTCFYG